jgi:hypothetical protein
VQAAASAASLPAAIDEGGIVPVLAVNDTAVAPFAY